MSRNDIYADPAAWKAGAVSLGQKMGLIVVAFALVVGGAFLGSYLAAQYRHDACEQRNADRPPAIAVGGIPDPNYRPPEDCGP